MSAPLIPSVPPNTQALKHPPRGVACAARTFCADHHGDDCPTLTQYKNFSPVAWDRQCRPFPCEEPKPVRTPGNTTQHTCGAFMPPPPSMALQML